MKAFHLSTLLLVATLLISSCARKKDDPVAPQPDMNSIRGVVKMITRTTIWPTDLSSSYTQITNYQYNTNGQLTEVTDRYYVGNPDGFSITKRLLYDQEGKLSEINSTSSKNSRGYSVIDTTMISSISSLKIRYNSDSSILMLGSYKSKFNTHFVEYTLKKDSKGRITTLETIDIDSGYETQQTFIYNEQDNATNCSITTNNPRRPKNEWITTAYDNQKRPTGYNPIVESAVYLSGLPTYLDPNVVSKNNAIIPGYRYEYNVRGLPVTLNKITIREDDQNFFHTQYVY